MCVSLLVASLLVVAVHRQPLGCRVAAFSPSPALHRFGATVSKWAVFGGGMPSPPEEALDRKDDAGAVGNPPEVGNLLDSASRLRREAEALEAEVKEKRGTTGTEPAAAAATEASYKSLPDSTWMITYRFASEPPPKDDEQISEAVAMKRPMQYYSGKFVIKFRADGYTDIIDEGVVKNIAINKIWGWDEEVSAEDGLSYILFSADVMLPDTDKNAQAGPTRFYFQARVDKDDRTGSLSLSDGKVTVKRGIEPPGGFWGVFSGKGILAQFRDVGDFKCRAAAQG